MDNESTIAHYNPEKAIAAQAAFCKASKIPQFAPIDGICERCGRNIYLPVKSDDSGRGGKTSYNRLPSLPQIILRLNAGEHKRRKGRKL